MTIYDGNSIAKVLSHWGFSCKFKDYSIAPQTIKYSFTMKNLSNLQGVKKMGQSLSALLGCSVSFCEELGDYHFAINVQRQERKSVELKRFGGELTNSSPNSLMLGIDTENRPIMAQLKDLPHMLIAGTTGSGKSVALNSFIMELCCYNKVGVLGVVLIDLKRQEFCKFEKLPHLLEGVAYDSERAEQLLGWLVYEMEARYSIFQNNPSASFKTICVFIDELTDLIMQSPKSKEYLVKLLQKARACDIHIICATQSPRAKILDGLMLANLPTRIALTCASVRESMLVLGHKGAESLLGRGDALLKLPSQTREIRIQIPYISDGDIQKILGGKR